MLIKQSLLIRKTEDLPQAAMQLVMDFEVMLADMGLEFQMLCMKCQRGGDFPQCEGRADFEAGVYGIACACTDRVYRGELYVPRAPRELRKPRLDLFVIPEINLTREQMAMFENINTLLGRMKIRYLMRCLACRLEDRLTDGVWGQNDSTATEYRVDCACTKRIYRGADAPVPVH